MTLTNLPAPFPPLVSGGEGLERYPGSADALTERMAEVYGVPVDHVLPVRGVTHAVELLLRLALKDGGVVRTGQDMPWVERLRAVYPKPGSSPRQTHWLVGGGWPDPTLAEQVERAAPGLWVVDEGGIEFSDTTSAAGRLGDLPNLVVLRSLSTAYGLAGARVGAVLARPEVIRTFNSVLEPFALSEPSIRLALQALDPSRIAETEARIARVMDERARMVSALSPHMRVVPEAGPFIRTQPFSFNTIERKLIASAIPYETDEALRLPVSIDSQVNDRALAALGVATGPARAHRVATVTRDTKETRIVCAVDLDAPGPVAISTGVGFFDHMLEQIAAHGGFSLRLACEGDLHTDPHHTIEDSAIALGQALKQALGERRGIARYGFVLPMDEARASVTLDLSGRPYPVFEGSFDTPMIGDYRTDLTAHVFRSLAEHLGAAIHVSVTGDDDHHKTEAAYKAFGRALRQAIRVEGEAVPSTKGVL